MGKSWAKTFDLTSFDLFSNLAHKKLESWLVA
nr:MAG TPA: hypothetical protein [Caudoviricetes sp.]